MEDRKVALVTGGNRGIGFETARQLAKLGYLVWVGVRDETKGEAAVGQLADEGLDARWVVVDAERFETFGSAAERISSESGRLDVLVNNAGTMVDGGQSIEQVSMADWRKTFEINFFGVVDLTRHFLPLLRRSPAGRIVNVSSILGSLALNADPNSPIAGWRSPAYNASKTALNAFTALLSAELHGTSIKVNSAHPGWVKTELGGEGAQMEIPDGAKTSVALATLDENGPTGAYMHMGDVLPW